MPERTQYTPGTFCWTDLTCTDRETAKAFYTGLFGWEAVDLPTGGGDTFAMMRIGGKPVATIVPQPPPMREAGDPPAWNSYVSVASADEAAQRAEELGASVVAPPFDIPGSGRMAAFVDPQGAYFLVWELREHFGAQLVNQHGALTWNDLNTPDAEASRGFYGELFGWSFEAFEGSPSPYFVIRNGDQGNGGVRESGDGAPGWLVYFGTDDIDTSLAKVAELGGTTLMEPEDIGVGKIAVARDSIGATFALYAGQFAE